MRLLFLLKSYLLILFFFERGGEVVPKRSKIHYSFCHFLSDFYGSLVKQNIECFPSTKEIR